MVILAFIPATQAVNPSTAALPLLFVLTTSAIKDAVEDYKRRKSDLQVNYSVTTRVVCKERPLTREEQQAMARLHPLSFLTQPLMRCFDALVARCLASRQQREKIIREYEATHGTLDGKPSDEKHRPSPSTKQANNQGGQFTELSSDESSDRSVSSASSVSASSQMPDIGGGRADQLPANHSNGRLLERVLWQELRVGDIVRLVDGDAIPADVVLIGTSDPQNLCYVDTASMDGETNLKPKEALALTRGRCASAQGCVSLAARVQCESPNNNLFRFQGSMAFAEDNFAQTDPIGIQNVLFRSCILRNTDYIYGLVVYAGHDTKVLQNSSRGRFKRTKMDKMMNKEIIFVFVILILFCLIGAILSAVNGISPPETHWYLYFPTNRYLSAFINFWSFALILQSLVPISLYVTVEMVKLVQALFISQDLDMYWAATDTPAWARTSALSEELGQLEYIFSDKTGTLTQNRMVFHGCSVNGVIYGAGSTSKTQPVTSNSPYSQPMQYHDAAMIRQRLVDKHLIAFWEHLALCHTVMAEYKEADKTRPQRLPETLSYQAQSPDEACLVAAARDFGFAFVDRTMNVVKINIDGQDRFYDVLNVLEFNSDRKRMSVIIRTRDTNEIKLLLKGADDVVIPLLAPLAKSALPAFLTVPGAEKKEGGALSARDLLDATRTHLDNFAKRGLRTLCLAWKPLTEDEWRAFDAKFSAAAISKEDREQAIAEVSASIENGLQLVGATAVDDKLQDHVADTIAVLARGGIKLWMLTGDKQETAINIGFSCKIFRRGMQVLILNATDAESTQARITELLGFVTADLAAGTASDKDSPLNEAASTDPSIAFSTSQDPLTKSASDPMSQVARDRISTIIPGAITASAYSTGSHSSGDHPFGASASTSSAGDPSRMNNSNPDGRPVFGLVVNGATLVHSLSPELKDQFLSLAKQCASVVCCRCSPLQKASVVDLVRKGLGTITLAIGDGANDVSMIKAANIGVGISGNEGMQAVMASDYAIAQFSFLRKLLLVHGVWSYHRITWLVLYFFYKNYAYILVNFWFNTTAGFSAQTVYEYTYIMFFNLAFTSLPPIVLAVFEQPVKARAAMLFPELYLQGMRNELFNKKQFWLTILDATYQSLICYLIPRFAIAVAPTGQQYDMWSLGTVCYTTLVVLVNLRLALDTHMWTKLSAVICSASVLLWFLYMLVYMNVLAKMNSVFGVVFMLWPNPTYWFTVILSVTTAIMPYAIIKYAYSIFNPTNTQVVREMYLLRTGRFEHVPRDSDTWQYSEPEEPSNSIPMVELSSSSQDAKSSGLDRDISTASTAPLVGALGSTNV
ncbi:hypothetical protein, variant [Capsaspora owczarzaki ATCC 30864]|nr:hypothetical protein, variant [Capsaspora owczarzaki ATCC 30864]